MLWLNGREQHPDIAIVGDSLTVGEHASSPFRSYPRLVHAALSADANRRLSFRVTAVSGARVVDLAGRELPIARRVAIVEAGTNDWLGQRPAGPCPPTELDAFAAGYCQLLDRVDDGRAAALVCLGIWGPKGQRGRIGGRLAEYEAAISAACEVRGGVMVTLSPVYEEAAARGPAERRTPFGVSDEMHPNDQGHARIAELVIDAVREALSPHRPIVTPEVESAAAAG